MRFYLGHPSYPQYGFYTLAVEDTLEEEINRLGPFKLIAGAYDWPFRFGAFRGWTDCLNSLWWPDGAESFSTCVLLIDDFRNDLLVQCVAQQRAALPPNTWRWPSLELICYLSPPEGSRPGESYTPASVGPVDVLTEHMAWLLYPLAPVNLTSLTNLEKHRGLWLLPLVDIRYFLRNVPLNSWSADQSTSLTFTSGYPLIEVSKDSVPNWMPPVLGYPQDNVTPSNFVPISNQGTFPSINGSMRWGEAADLQADMENWRIVCRDIRTNHNVPSGDPPHNSFKGVIADYPENWVDPNTRSYHLDALNLIIEYQMRIAGGECDVRSLDEFTARKLQFLFRVIGSDSFYSITIQADIDYPLTITQLSEDADGPDPTEARLIPSVNLGIEVSSRYPDSVEHDQLVSAAKQWALLYYAWRMRQTYMRMPGIIPLIPNGHAKMIRWDFPNTKVFRTTYIALEGVQGTRQAYSVIRQPFYAVIDGEGALQDNLHGYYAFTELLDKDGQLTVHPNPRRGFVFNVNGSIKTINPARDEAGKVAVPVGLVIWLKPGVPYLDITAGEIFDHYLFTTTDLVQVVRLKDILEINEFGHFGAIIQRWNPDIKQFTDSKDIWVVILD